jgi:Rad3-related DNA helicase
MTTTAINTTLSIADFIKHFPKDSMRDKQQYVLNEICNAFNSAYKYILLEAPTGFGKSPVAVAVGRTLGSSYICSATKDLQAQYVNDFPFLKSAVGMGNYKCLVKEDFIRNKKYECESCSNAGISNLDECDHISVEYGTCKSNESFRHTPKDCNACTDGDGSEHMGCKYRTFPRDYEITNLRSTSEQISISDEARERYESNYNAENWMYLRNFDKQRDIWQACSYYDQRNIALLASHTIFNYSNFLRFLPTKLLESRDLLVLDEGHLIESQLVEYLSLSISRKKWRKYIPYLELNADGNLHDIEKWLDFLSGLQLQMEVKIDEWTKNKKLVTDEFLIEATKDKEKLDQTIDTITQDSENWIVSEIKEWEYFNTRKRRNETEIVKVTFKALDISSYCKKIFEKCDKTLIMSATILNQQEFCKSVGLAEDKVKFIQVGSDFPVQNRPIYALNVARLNYATLQQQEVIKSIAKSVDKIMTLHKNDKGIIHTTSYSLLNSIRDNISLVNKRRLIVTNPEIDRHEVVKQHIDNEKASVLISPSLYLGLDLKDDFSRFQIITKIPYPNLSDLWIKAKTEKNQKWYDWQTALRLIQTYGRSIRSKDDYAKTYVLDAKLGDFLMRNKMPDWFTSAITRFS